MNLKTAAKRCIVGPPGMRQWTIKWGLLQGLRFYLDTATQSQRVMGLAEAEIARTLRRFAASTRSAVDVGANDGWYSLYFASQPQIECVVAVDAKEAVLATLESNFALNDPAFEKKLTRYVEFVGVDDSDTTISLDRLTGDLPRPVLVKIDVDGGELDVLRGASRLIASGEANFVVETHSKDLEIACVRLLKEQGYVVTIVRNAWYRTFVPEQRPISHNRWFVAHHPNALS